MSLVTIGLIDLIFSFVCYPLIIYIVLFILAYCICHCNFNFFCNCYITIVTVFCTVHKPFPEINYYLVKKIIPSVINRQYQARSNIKQNSMKITCLFYFVSQVLKLLLTKSYTIQLSFSWVLRRGLEARGKSSDIV